MVKLVIFPGSATESVVPLDNRLRLALGRARDCDVVLPRRMASRNHAIIELRDGRYVIRDMDSYNGTFVNERPVREMELAHGDQIRIADCIMRFLSPRGGSEDAVDPSAATAPTVPAAVAAPAEPLAAPPAASPSADEDTPAEMHHYTVTTADVDLLEHEPAPAPKPADAQPASLPSPAEPSAGEPALAVAKVEPAPSPARPAPTQPAAARPVPVAPPPPSRALATYVAWALGAAGLIALAVLLWRAR